MNDRTKDVKPKDLMEESFEGGFAERLIAERQPPKPVPDKTSPIDGAKKPE